MNASNPLATLQLMAGGFGLSRCLHVVAELGVADVLDDTPQTATELAAAVNVDAEALGRVLRLLAAHEVFAVEGDRFGHSPASRLLRADHPRSMRAFVRMMGLPFNWDAYRELGYSVRTGLPAADQLFPGGFWAYTAAHPEANAVFNAAMAARSHGQVAAIVASCDFAGFGRIGDIGGGRGHLLRAVLDANPDAAGVLFDLPQVIAEAAAQAPEPLTLQAGDFFRDDLPACDAYLLMEILHDWADPAAVAILRAIRRAAPDHARLFVFETMIPDDPGPDWSKLLDVHMLTWVGGCQRSRPAFEALLDAAGFVLVRQHDTGAGISVLEAKLA